MNLLNRRERKLTYCCHGGCRVKLPKLEIQKAVRKEEDVNNETSTTCQEENRGGNCSGSPLRLERDPLLTFNQ